MSETEPSEKQHKDWGFRSAISGGVVTIAISALNLDELKIPGTGFISSAASMVLPILFSPISITILAFGIGAWTGVRWQKRRIVQSAAAKVAAERQKALARSQEYGFGGELIRAGEMLERYATKLPGQLLKFDHEAGLRSSNVSLEIKGIPTPKFKDLSDPKQFKRWSHFFMNVGSLLQDHHFAQAVEFAREALKD